MLVIRMSFEEEIQPWLKRAKDMGVLDKLDTYDTTILKVVWERQGNTLIGGDPVGLGVVQDYVVAEVGYISESELLERIEKLSGLGLVTRYLALPI